MFGYFFCSSWDCSYTDYMLLLLSVTVSYFEKKEQGMFFSCFHVPDKAVNTSYAICL